MVEQKPEELRVGGSIPSLGTNMVHIISRLMRLSSCSLGAYRIFFVEHYEKD